MELTVREQSAAAMANASQCPPGWQTDLVNRDEPCHVPTLLVHVSAWIVIMLSVSLLSLFALASARIIRNGRARSDVSSLLPYDAGEDP